MKKIIKALISLTISILAVIISISSLITTIDAFKYYKEQEWTKINFVVTNITSSASYGKFTYEGYSYDAIYYDNGMSKKDEEKEMYFRASQVGKTILFEITPKPYKPNLAGSICFLAFVSVSLFSSICLSYLSFSNYKTLRKLNKANKKLS